MNWYARQRVIPWGLATILWACGRAFAQPPAPPFYQSLAWSPDGTRIAYCAVVTDWKEGFAIYVMNADGSDVRALTQAGERALYPAWSPDGRRIAYGAGQGETSEIFVVDLESGEHQQLTHNDLADNGPNWSPDGTEIAYHTKHEGQNDIYLIRADGTAPRILGTTPAKEWNPMWSPDGDAIVCYATRPDSDVDDLCLFEIEVSDSLVARCTTLPVTGVFPTWADSGRAIVFSDRSSPDRKESALFVVGRDGKNRRKLQDNSFYGAISPSGDQLAYVEYVTDQDGSRRYAIRVRPLAPDEIPSGNEAK